ncbi:MAG: hypothetical protein NVV74_05300 [Magnetospirillum sp.]|nr:hypothetical protein [Magnetospirillum sp.]
MSRLGTSLCALYALIIAICVATAYSSGDSKGRYVLLQLPIAPQMALIHELGLVPSARHLSWVEVYALLGSPTFAILYGFGWLVDRRRQKKP